MRRWSTALAASPLALAVALVPAAPALAAKGTLDIHIIDRTNDNNFVLDLVQIKDPAARSCHDAPQETSDRQIFSIENKTDQHVLLADRPCVELKAADSFDGHILASGDTTDLHPDNVKAVYFPFG
ncbi:hypothetical protein ACQP1W_21465 [Spirillospora sp. CA-255316]